MDTNQKLHQNNLGSINRDKLRNLFLSPHVQITG